MTTYLVIGCAGFIGTTFVHYILNRYTDIKIINLDALTYAGNLVRWGQTPLWKHWEHWGQTPLRNYLYDLKAFSSPKLECRRGTDSWI